MKKSSITHSFKPDRKTIEKNRRIYMKRLCFKLSSLLPPNHLDQSKEMLSQQDQIDKAAAYITELKDRIEGLKVRKELMERKNGLHINIDRSSRCGSSPSSLPPAVFDLREWDSGFELTLMSGVYKNFRLYEVISILEEEGTEVVSVSVSKVGDKVIHSIHAKVRISRDDVETTRMRERLQDLIYSF